MHVHNDATDSLNVSLTGRKTQVIQTHNAVSVAASGLGVGSWIDCNGFDQIAFTFLNDAGASASADLQWSNDGANQHGLEAGVIILNNSRYKQGITPTKARYCRLILSNGDTGAAHTMSVWAYLKA